MTTITKIKQWGKDRGITINGTHEGQWLKLVSEYGELCDNLAKGKDIRDDIGDMFVVLVMICEIAGVDVDRAYNTLAMPDHRPSGSMLDLVGTIHIDVGSLRFAGNITQTRAADLITALAVLAHAHGLTIGECIELAYNDIKDRVGYLSESGVFVKGVKDMTDIPQYSTIKSTVIA